MAGVDHNQPPDPDAPQLATTTAVGAWNGGDQVLCGGDQNKVLSAIISLKQAGFLEGRSIHDCIGVAHDLIRDINHKVFGGNIMVKLDMSKAYARLYWRFLLRIM
ncbi:hypothetical protein QQ045_015398 [Rhodiola kirilowii]